MIVARRTVSRTVALEGLGLHSGEPVRVRIHPGEDGIAFRRGETRTAARPENVTDTRRCTRLGEVSTIEHLMSAFAGLGVTDAEVEADAELPGLDGSALPFFSALRDAGLTELGQTERPALFKRVFLQEGETKIAIARGHGHWRYVFDSGDRWPGVQEFDALQVTEAYEREIAPARTLVFGTEVEAARAAGLGRGLDETSVVVLDEGGYRFPTRFPEEPARHKLLDLIGDLYLAGIPIHELSVVGERSGHKSNVEAAHRLLQMLGEAG